jgi:flavin-dependent dehydrogenase
VSRGAELLSPCRVTGIETDGATVRLATDRGPLSAAFVVAADGATGTLAKAAGWDAARSAIPALELEASVDQDTFARFAGTAWFDFGIPSAGYAWVFPKARHLSIGVLSTRRGRGALTHSLQIYLDRLGIVPRAAERHGYVIPIRPVRAPLVRNRTIAVGDAAGLADPLTAEGISYAALSARLAAEALLGGTLDEERVRVHYTRALRRQVFPGLRAARLLARVVYGPRLQHLLYRTVGDKLADAVADVTLGTRSYAAALLDPHTYLARRQEVAST